jgi:REP element-mobilizing transposase RayT
VARPLRIEYENAFYHITARGNERKNIFADRNDNEKFLSYIGLLHKRYKIIVYSYVLMDNHYHLLIETPEPNLSRMMRDINGHYTIYFNKTHKRYGHLFQGRYKAILVDKDNYLLELTRYIHLNPVRAGILPKPEDYRYSSMAYYTGKKTPPEWMNIKFLLKQFGNTLKEQQAGYKRFVYAGIGELENPFKKTYANSILGSNEFIEEITSKYLRGKDISEQVPESKKLRYGKNLKEIAMAVMKYYDIDKRILNRRKAKFNKGKKVFVYLARQYTDNKLSEIKEFLDNSVTSVAISKLFSRTEEEIIKHRSLRRDIEKIEKLLFDKTYIYHVKT